MGETEILALRVRPAVVRCARDGNRARSDEPDQHVLVDRQVVRIVVGHRAETSTYTADGNAGTDTLNGGLSDDECNDDGADQLYSCETTT